MKKHLIFLILILPNLLFGTSTFYKGVGGKINDKGSGVDFKIKLSGITPNAATDTFGIEAVCIKVSHKDVSKLAFSLVAPDGTTIALATNIGSGNRYDSTIFSDTGTMLIDLSKVPFRNNYKAEGQLKLVNDGQLLDTNWTLHITDSYSPAGTGGSLTYWYLVVGDHPASDVKLFSSNLPILVINTRGVSMPYWSKTMADMRVIYNNSGNRNFLRDTAKNKGYCMIGIRGSSSSGFPKKSYSLITTDKNGVSKDTNFMGFPIEHSWDLIANYTDKTLLHNYLTYLYGRRMGHCSARTKFAEVIVNGVYQGVFLVDESIKKNINRVNINKLGSADTTGDALTGGYIIKIDKFTGTYTGYWASNYSPPNHAYGQQILFQYDYPYPLQTQQTNYIQKYIDSFETALNGSNYQDTVIGWRKYAYENDMIDYFISTELCRNVDGYRLSTFLYKDRNSVGGKIHMGPLWDYDLAWGNANYYSGSSTSGWAYTSTDPGDGFQTPFWWGKFLKDSTYKNNLKCRWTVLRRNMLSDSAIKSDITNAVNILSESEVRNFNEWPELGVYVWPEPSYPATYALEISNLRKWVKARTLWLDKNIPGTCRKDITPPVVALNYKDTVYLEVNTQYKDSGITYNDNVDGKACKIVISQNVDSSTLGTYVYYYDVYDKAGNKTEVHRIVIVIDTIPPTINFVNGDTINLEVLTKYSEKDVIITDNYDTALVKSRSGNFNFINNIPDSLGTYTLKYTATDKSGNSTAKTRYIHVIDSIPPVINFIGHPLVNLKQNDSYTDSGYIVKDNFDSFPTVTKGGTFLNTLLPGSFTLTYQAMDHSGNKSNLLTRTINVASTTGISNEENINEIINVFPNPSKGSITLNSNVNKYYHVELIDNLGITVQYFTWNAIQQSNISFNLSGSLSDGIYILKIYSGTSSFHQQLILKR